MHRMINKQAIRCLNQGGIIAYPTESVYGLGCDPFNETAIKKLLAIKKRAWQKGFIVIAHDWQQLQDLLLPIPEDRMRAVKATWPGPVTWLFPAKKTVSPLLRGDHDNIAVRITAHPIAKALAQAFGKPIVSTSANREGQEPAITAEQVHAIFQDKINVIIDAEVGPLTRPTEIRDALTGVIMRKGGVSPD